MRENGVACGFMSVLGLCLRVSPLFPLKTSEPVESIRIIVLVGELCLGSFDFLFD